MIKTIAVFCVIGSPILAECPVATDLETGIGLTLQDDTVEIYRLFRPGVIEVSTDRDDGTVGKTLLGQGVYVISYYDTQNGTLVSGSRTNISFPTSPKDMPLPVPLATGSFTTVMLSSGGFSKEQLTIKWGPLSEAIYGDCTYDMIPGTLTYNSENYDHQEVVHYLPELGFGSLYSYFDDDMDEPDVVPVIAIAVSGEEQ